MDVDLIDTDETLVYEFSIISAINIDEQNSNTVEIIVDPEQHFLFNETSFGSASDDIKCKFCTSIFFVKPPCKV